MVQWRRNSPPPLWPFDGTGVGLMEDGGDLRGLMGWGWGRIGGERNTNALLMYNEPHVLPNLSQHRHKEEVLSYLCPK